MRIITLALILFLSGGTAIVNAQDTKAATIKEFLKDVISLENEKVSTVAPIKSFNEIAKTKAAKTITLTKENAKESMAEIKNYKNCVITVGRHTIVKVTDAEKCVNSGAWGASMPYGEGYIQKGVLTPQKDYINNIIGIPDTQERLMFLFK